MAQPREEGGDDERSTVACLLGTRCWAESAALMMAAAF